MTPYQPGDLVVRTGRYPRGAGKPPEVQHIIARIERTSIDDDPCFVFAHPLACYCYIEGHVDLGRKLPVDRGLVCYFHTDVRPLFLVNHQPQLEIAP